MIYPLQHAAVGVLILIRRLQRRQLRNQPTVKTVSNTKDSTLYPILKRLQENGLVDTYDQQFQGRNRRYYKITVNMVTNGRGT